MRSIGGTPTANTGPAVDQSTGTATGRYLYVEDSNAVNAGDVIVVRGLERPARR